MLRLVIAFTAGAAVAVWGVSELSKRPASAPRIAAQANRTASKKSRPAAARPRVAAVSEAVADAPVSQARTNPKARRFMIAERVAEGASTYPMAVRTFEGGWRGAVSAGGDGKNYSAYIPEGWIEAAVLARPTTDWQSEGQIAIPVYVQLLSDDYRAGIQDLLRSNGIEGAERVYYVEHAALINYGRRTWTDAGMKFEDAHGRLIASTGEVRRTFDLDDKSNVMLYAPSRVIQMLLIDRRNRFGSIDPFPFIK